MSIVVQFIVLVALAAAAWSHDAIASKRTVCTITVNSPDEKEAFRRYLPADQYEFVELVQHGRPDWLAAACQRRISCDILIVSGHFNGHDFFSDKLEAREYLPVQEMERASCSDSCPGLFSHLKEVYLFGCTSLSPDPGKSAPGEILRSLERSGHGAPEAQRLAQQLVQLHRDSNRDVMRRIFAGVPAVYGFSAVAPLGPTSAGLLNRYFAGGRGEVGTGIPNHRLLGQFAAHSMAVVDGIPTSDPVMKYRGQVCEFVDDRQSPAQKLRFIHQLLDGEMAQARLFFERIETFFATLPADAGQQPDFAAALDDVAHDRAARERYLALARDADSPAIRARMIQIGYRLGWLDDDGRRSELAALLRDLLAKPAMSLPDVDLACSLDARELDGALAQLRQATDVEGHTDRSAALACLGSAEDHARMLLALSSSNEQDVRFAEVYFQHRPIGTVEQLRAAIGQIARMNDPGAQVRALDTVGRLRLSDREALAELATLFPRTRSVQVQRAIAGVFLRSDAQAIASLDLAALMQQSRLRSPDGHDAIDIAIHHLQQASLVREVRTGG
ncbi:MAG TPA: hypothetical protein VMV45_17015 [Casimicrobiaceae bacterium]|nr:hypothetical protein [Casimicrobiaceae bacterium]